MQLKKGKIKASIASNLQDKIQKKVIEKEIRMRTKMKNIHVQKAKMNDVYCYLFEHHNKDLI